MNEIDLIEKDSLQEVPSFKAGDTVSVYYKIKEGQKERIQIFEGLVISRKGTSIKETFTVRKISYGVGTERIFPIHSKQIEKIKVLRKGRVRRAKLYYIRGLSKKASRIKESNK
jgi:large subunit ribosomal protein L19|tara:strand:+ start:741 stop:1082 length:342 start_codon:yes stop_codon:yes gene_type:complete